MVQGDKAFRFLRIIERDPALALTLKTDTESNLRTLREFVWLVCILGAGMSEHLPFSKARRIRRRSAGSRVVAETKLLIFINLRATKSLTALAQAASPRRYRCHPVLNLAALAVARVFCHCYRHF